MNRNQKVDQCLPSTSNEMSDDLSPEKAALIEQMRQKLTLNNVVKQTARKSMGGGRFPPRRQPNESSFADSDLTSASATDTSPGASNNLPRARNQLAFDSESQEESEATKESGIEDE